MRCLSSCEGFAVTEGNSVTAERQFDNRGLTQCLSKLTVSAGVIDQFSRIDTDSACIVVAECFKDAVNNVLTDFDSIYGVVSFAMNEISTCATVRCSAVLIARLSVR